MTGGHTNAYLAAVSALASCFHISVVLLLLLLKGTAEGKGVLIVGLFVFFFRLLHLKNQEGQRL
jgi:hypothetical protein